MKVVEFTNRCKEVQDILRNTADENPNLESVVILGIFKDGSQLIQTSNCTAHEKAFMCAFFNAWISKWFQLDKQK